MRIKRFLIAFASYFIWCSIFVFTFLLGVTHIPLYALPGCFSGILITNILIYATIRSGFNKRFEDPSLTLPQMVIATFWTMVFLYYAGTARSAVLLLYLVVFIFGLFKLKIREFLFLSLFAVVNYTVVILLIYKFHPESANYKNDLLNLVILATVLPWFSLVGGYITKLKAKVSNALSTIGQMTNNIHDVIFVMDMNLNYTYVSPSVKILRGYEPEEVLKQAPFDAIMPPSLDLAKRTLSEVMELDKSGDRDPISRTLQMEIRRKDGSTVWTETKVSLIRDKNQQTVGFLGVIRDNTERKRMEEALRHSEEKYRNILQNMQEGYFEVDLAGKFSFVNDSLCRIHKRSKDEMLSMGNRRYMDKETAKKVFQAFNRVYETGEPQSETEWQITRKDGKRRFIEASVSLLKDSSGIPIGFRGVTRDITERKHAEETLRESEQKYLELSIIDDLTRLYNSRHFYAQLEKEIERSNRYEQPLTLILLDLDNFKMFNDTYGHVEGDYVLSRLGQVIKRCLRDTDSAYRYGGEEFTIILPMTTSGEGIVTAKRIQTELGKEVFYPAGQKVHLTVSTGLSQYKLKEEMKAFVHRVDQLMYDAKKNGRDRICSES